MEQESRKEEKTGSDGKAVGLTGGAKRTEAGRAAVKRDARRGGYNAIIALLRFRAEDSARLQSIGARTAA